MSMNLDFLTPYENFLLQNEDHVHQVIQDIQACKIELLRRTSINALDNILDLFNGTSKQRKKEEFVEFLRLMPEYRSTDLEVLYRRLKALQDQLKVTQGTSDLYLYASRKHAALATNQNE